MILSSLHILLTYQCTFECDHCFVWGSPWQTGTLTLDQIQDILRQAKEACVEWIYLEGGEPFLYYAIMLKAVHLAKEMGFSVGVVSNAFWARSLKDSIEWLRPLSMLDDLSISSDLYHYDESMSSQAKNAVAAAGSLGIPVGTISVAQPDESQALSTHGQIQPESSAQMMYRGRAAVNLVKQAVKSPWQKFDQCPHEDFLEPGRVHLDPLGNLHICQGILLGNLFNSPLKEICSTYEPDLHPICGPLRLAGPVALLKEYNLPHRSKYADACHLCYEARLSLRARFPDLLAPDQVYGSY